MNPVEAIIRSGGFGNMIPVPWVPGSDVGGLVDKVGAAVSNLKVRTFLIGTLY